MDKAGKNYWNETWACSDIPNAVNPLEKGSNNLVKRRFHELFIELFDGMETTSMRILEVGCAKSSWLPYFSNEFGFEVVGLDYSLIGCEMARAILNNSGVEGSVVCSDLFSPPLDMIGTFDLVVSFGVVEHFEDTDVCIRAISSFLKPGGMLITNIPNMVGWIGAIEKIVNRPVYDIHQLIDSSMLRKEHERAGLEVLECDYFMSTNFGVCNLNGIPENTILWFLKKAMLGILTRVSILVWFFEDKFGMFPLSQVASPYVICVARK